MKKTSTFFRTKYILCLASCLLQWSLVNAQIVTNGRFHGSNNCSPTSCTPGWEVSHGIVQFSPPGASTPPLRSNCSIYTTTDPFTGGVYTPVTLTANQTYTLTFWSADWGVITQGASSSASNNFYIVAALASGLTPTTNHNSPVVPTPNSYLELVRAPVAQTTWTQRTAQFTAPSWGNTQLWLYTAANMVSGTGFDAMRISLDSVTIASTCPTGDIYYQNTSSLPADTRTQGKIYAGSSVDNTRPSGPVTVQSSQTVAFRSLSEIQLKDGFSAESGSTFEALIVRCQGINARGDSSASVPPTNACSCLANSTNRMSYIETRSVAPAMSTDNAEPVSPQLYPNPTTGKFSFSPEWKALANTGDFHVYDKEGVEVSVLHFDDFSSQENGLQIDMSSLPDGLYHYRFLSGSYSARGSFSIQK